MIYKGHEIVAEAITARAEYSLDEDGNLYEFLQDIDCEPDITCYGIVKDGEIIDWTDTLEEAKQYIDEEII